MKHLNRIINIPELCVVCKKRPIVDRRNHGRHPSVTCGSECSNMLSSSDTLKAAQAKYKKGHVADDAFEKFVYPEEIREHHSN